MSGLYGNAVGAPAILKTVILTDENGNELIGVVTGSEVIMTATADDIKIGKIAATDEGFVEGIDTKTYRVETGIKAIFPNSEFKIILKDYDMYDYSQLQAMIMPYDTSMSQSTAVNKVIINDNVYNTNSNTVISVIFKDSIDKSINLGITNESTPYLIRYFLYKEEI